MTRIKHALVIAAILLAPKAYAVGENEAELLKSLPASKHSLLDGIQQVTVSGETPTAAKFEYENGALYLAIYSSAKGTKVDAEHNVLKEFKGDPKQGTWKPGVEIFKDVEHISRAAEYHTLMEISPYSIADIAKKAQSEGENVVWVIPVVSNGTASFDVGVLKGGKIQHIRYGLLDGKLK